MRLRPLHYVAVGQRHSYTAPLAPTEVSVESTSIASEQLIVYLEGEVKDLPNFDSKQPGVPST